MKSNFEKGLIGAAIVASSFGATEAQEQKIAGADISKKIEISVEQEKGIPEKSISFEDAKKSLVERNILKENDQKRIETIRAELGLASQKDEKMNPEFYREQYIKYMEHPSYKQRLSKEMFGDNIIDTKKQELIDKEYIERLEQIKKVPISMLQDTDPDALYDPSHYGNKNGRDSVVTTRRAAPHEFSHSLDMGKHGIIEEGFNQKLNSFLEKDTGGLESEGNNLNIKKDSVLSETESIMYKENHEKFIETLRKYIDDNKDNTEFKERNSFNVIKNNVNDLNSSYFTVQDFFKFFHYLDQIKIMKENRDLLDNLSKEEGKIKEFSDKIKNLESEADYLKNNSEVKARLNYLRIKAIKENGYDLNNEFNINNFDELKNDSQYKDLKDKLGLSDNQINELMKYTAGNIIKDNNQNKDVNNYA